MSEWRDISSAPENGDMVNLRLGIRVYRKCFWSERDTVASWAQKIPGIDIHEDFRVLKVWPTHWQPATD